jgi:hypothetical protein
MTANLKTDKGAPKRAYSQRTLKILFALSRNRCAAPGCSNSIIKEATDKSDELVVGQICHIYAVSNDGPRGKIGLSEAERNDPKNLILCCPTHHVVVDGQHETYPASLLLNWKAKQERAYGESLTEKMSAIGYAELEVAAKALMSASDSADQDVSIIPPKEKIALNSLSPMVAMLIRMGTAKSKEVAEVLLNGAQLDGGFPDRLRNGFAQKYNELVQNDYESDELFYAMYEWAGGDGAPSRQAAGLFILSHLFVICDVFEKVMVE